MVGKEYVYSRSIMEMNNLFQCERWGVNTSRFENRLEIEKRFSWSFGLVTSIYFTAEKIISAVKFASRALDYPFIKGIPIK